MQMNSNEIKKTWVDVINSFSESMNTEMGSYYQYLLPLVTRLAQSKLSEQFRAGQSMGRFFFTLPEIGTDRYKPTPYVVIATNPEGTFDCRFYQAADNNDEPTERRQCNVDEAEGFALSYSQFI